MAVGLGTSGRTANATVNVRSLRAGKKTGDSLYRVPLDDIATDPEQPRKTFNGAELEALAASIKQHGVINPVEVRSEGGSFVLICGERRLRAAKMAGLKAIPALIRKQTTEQERRVRQLVENIQRSDLPVLDLAAAYKALFDSGMKQKDVAKEVGKSRATVSMVIRCGEFVAGLQKDLREKVQRVELSLRSLYECASEKPMEKGIARLRGLVGDSPTQKKKATQKGAKAAPAAPTKAQLNRTFKGMDSKAISALLVERLPASLLGKIYHLLR